MKKNNLKNIIGYEPSEYQVKIFDYLTESSGNLVVSAKAGSGKTSTLVSSLSLLPKRDRKLFLAFNKSIVKEIRAKVDEGGISHVDVSTTHSKGFELLRKYVIKGKKFDIQEFKYYNLLRETLEHKLNIPRFTKWRDIANLDKQLIEKCMILIEESRFSMKDRESALGEAKGDRERLIVECSFDTLDKGLYKAKKHGLIDFLDMLWIPVIENVEVPVKDRYSIVYIDEVQDITYTTYKLFQKFISPNGRFVAVGDERQRINGFAGSYSGIFDDLLRIGNTELMTLPVSFRCPKSIIRLAQKIVPEIKYHETSGEGVIKENTKLDELPDGTLVLGRQNSILLSYYFYLISKNRPCYIKGSELGVSIKKILSDLGDIDVDGIYNQLLLNLFSTRDSIYEEILVESAKKKIDPIPYDVWVDGFMDESFAQELEVIKSIQEITSSGIFSSIEEIISSLDIIFSETYDRDDRICLSTIHKSKGLECDTVCLSNQNFPNKFFESRARKRGLAYLANFREEEENLRYVALTRTKRELHYLDYSEFIKKGDSCSSMAEINFREYIKELEKECGYKYLPPSLLD